MLLVLIALAAPGVLLALMMAMQRVQDHLVPSAGPSATADGETPHAAEAVASRE